MPAMSASISRAAPRAWLLHQFCRLLTSVRPYGSVENAPALVLEAVDAVSKEWSADRIGIRVSPIGSFQNVDTARTSRVYLIEQLANAVSLICT